MHFLLKIGIQYSIAMLVYRRLRLYIFFPKIGFIPPNLLDPWCCTVSFPKSSTSRNPPLSWVGVFRSWRSLALGDSGTLEESTCRLYMLDICTMSRYRNLIRYLKLHIPTFPGTWSNESLMPDASRDPNKRPMELSSLIHGTEIWTASEVYKLLRD